MRHSGDCAGSVGRGRRTALGRATVGVLRQRVPGEQRSDGRRLVTEDEAGALAHGALAVLLRVQQQSGGGLAKESGARKRPSVLWKRFEGVLYCGERPQGEQQVFQPLEVPRIQTLASGSGGVRKVDHFDPRGSRWVGSIVNYQQGASNKMELLLQLEMASERVDLVTDREQQMTEETISIENES
eukprot:CAMPEP_0114565456 /NCGR_PEP_ID=MMETSP0114-20121206/14317_1 /TAXON_ID=31324 /ORGANISM="Goniomonas sp, Strain m" /LENGTH=184 /DNA_ID=CAMNT_0001751699 /DNA_START=942 /DNA_END=1496 /DNA_ORIENTATION=+